MSATSPPFSACCNALTTCSSVCPFLDMLSSSACAWALVQPKITPVSDGGVFGVWVNLTCVRWYFRVSLTLPDLEDLMTERGLSVDHITIWRWTQVYGLRSPPPPR